MARFASWPGSLVHAGGTLNFKHLENVNVSPQTTRPAIVPAGSIDSLAQIVAFADPSVTITTSDIDTIIATIDIANGLCATGVTTLRFARRLNCGTFATGAVNHTITAPGGGFIFPTSFSAEQDGQDGAQCELSFMPFYDGTNEPLLHNQSVDFAAAPAPGFVSRFYLSKVRINGITLDGVTSVRLDTNTTFSMRRESGQVYATGGAIVRREPRFTIQTFDLAAARAAGSSLINNSAPTVDVYFIKGLANGTRVAAGTNVHARISCSSMALNTENVSVSGTEDANASLAFAANGTLTSVVNAAIP